MVIQSSSSGVQSVKLNASSPEEFFAPEHLRRIHGLFEYDSMVEFSGLADLETGVLEYEKHSGASSVFPWGPQVVFHTHPCASGAEVYSVTDLFLFACAPAWVSLLFSEFRISVLEKQKTETEYFTMLRKKLDYLRSGGYLQKNSRMNSCYFSSILERMFPELKSIILHTQRIDFICKTMSFKLTEYQL